MVDGWANPLGMLMVVSCWMLLVDVARMFQVGFSARSRFSPVQADYGDIRQGPWNGIWLVWYDISKDEFSLSCFYFYLRSPRRFCLMIFFESFLFWEWDPHIFLEKGLGDGYMRTLHFDSFYPASLEKLRLRPFVPAILANEEGTKCLALSISFAYSALRKINSADAKSVKIQKQTGGMLRWRRHLSYTWPELAMISDVIQSFWMTKKYPINEAGETNESCPAFCCALNLSTTPIWPPVNGSIVVGVKMKTARPKNIKKKPKQQNHKNTGKATKGKVQDIGEVNKVMPLPLPSSVG